MTPEVTKTLERIADVGEGIADQPAHPVTDVVAVNDGDPVLFAAADLAVAGHLVCGGADEERGQHLLLAGVSCSAKADGASASSRTLASVTPAIGATGLAGSRPDPNRTRGYVDSGPSRSSGGWASSPTTSSCCGPARRGKAAITKPWLVAEGA